MTDQRNPLSAYLPTPVPIGPGAVKPVDRPSLSQMWAAGTTTSRADLPSADRDRLYDAYKPILEELNRGRNWFRRYHNPGAGGANFETYFFDEGGNPVVSAPTMQAQEDHIWAAIDARRAVDPGAFPGVPKSQDDFHQQVLDRAKAALRGARETIARNDSWIGTGAQIGAGVATSFRDPINIASLPIGGVGRSLATRIITAGVANAAVEAVEQPFVAEQRAKLGETLTTGEAATNVVAAAVFGAGLQGVGEGIVAPTMKAALATRPGQAVSDAARNVYGQGQALATAARERIGWANMTPAQRAATVSLERQADIAATSPYAPGPGMDAHVARVEATVKGMAAGEGVPPMPRARAFDAQTYANRVAVAESGGKWQVQAPTSSAYGLYQITEGTWWRYAQTVPSLRSLGRGAAWGRRTNPAAQEAVFTALTRDNRAALARAGVPETYGNLYMLHFAGSGAGMKILTAAPDEPIERLLSAQAIEANKFLKDKTAGEVVAIMHAKVGERPHAGPVLSREGFGDDAAGDMEWRAAQAEVDAAERELAGVRAEDAREAMPVEEDVPFELDDPRGRAFDAPERDPFDDLPDDLRDAPMHGADWEPDPAAPTDPANRFASEALRLEEAGGGEIAQALNHPAIGPIDVKWGYAGDAEKNWRGGYGLSHILAKHPEMRDQLADLPGIIRGMDVVKDDGRTIRLASERHEAGVRLDWDGKEQRWLVTAYEKGRQTPAAPVSSRDAAIDRASPDHGAVSDMRVAAAGDKAPAPGRIEGYDGAADVAAERQTDSMDHDLRMLMEADPNLTVRLDDEGPERTLRDVLDELDADEAAINAARACMTPGGKGGEA